MILDLFGEATAFHLDSYLKPRLTPAAVATLGIDLADDPGFLECEPWAFAREIFAPHQLEIEQLADRVEMLYGEWTILLWGSDWWVATAPRLMGVAD